MAPIATLTIDLVANSARFVEGLQKADKNSKSWADGVRRSATVAVKAMAGAAAATTAALAAMVVKSAESADAMVKQADSIGIAVEAMAGLRLVADLAGVSADKMGENMQKMSKNIGIAANTGTGAASDAIKALGLNIETLVAMTPDQQLGAIADALNNIDNRAQQAALAADIFGRSGVDMLNITDMGSAGINEMAAEAEALGLTLSRVDAAKIEQMNDSITRGQGILSGFGLQFTAKISPAITALVEKTVEWATAQGGVGKVADRVFNAIKNGAAFAADGVRGLQIVWQYIRLAVIELADASVSTFGAMYRGWLFLKEKITGEKINYDDTFLGAMDKSFSDAAEETKKKIDELALAPLPSTAMIKFFDDAAEKADLLAKQTAAAAEARIGTGSYQDVETSADEALRKKAEREREAAARKQQQDQERFARELEAVEQSFMTQEERLYESYMRRSMIITEALQRDQITAETYNELQAENERKYQNEKAELALKNEEVQRKAIEGVAGLQNSQNKQLAAAGKAAFLAKKIMATKEALIAGKLAVQQAWASAPFPANIPAVVLTVASTAANVAGIQGIAHGGLENVPSESTYLLDKGERVLSPKQNTDLTGYLAKENQSAGSSSGAPIIAIVSTIDEAKAFIASQDGRDAMIVSLSKEPDRVKSALKIA